VTFYSGKPGVNTLINRSSLKWAVSSEVDITAIISYRTMIIRIYKTLKNNILFQI